MLFHCLSLFQNLCIWTENVFFMLDLKRDLSGESNRNQIKPQYLCLKKSLGKIMQCLNPSLLVAGFVAVRWMC